MPQSKEPGYVYILTNPSFREDWVKIGKSSRPVDIRSKELDNTAVPLPFEIFATIKTVKYNEVEKLVHKTIDRLTDLRIRQNREFFNIEPQLALDIFNDIAATIDDAEVTIYKDNKPVLKADSTMSIDPSNGSKVNTLSHQEDNVLSKNKKKGNFKFSMVGIKIGDFVKFEPTGIMVRVASDDMVEYQDRIYKLSPFVGTFLPDELRYPSNQYQGAHYFSFEGEMLDKRRKRLESMNSDKSASEKD